MKKLYLIALLMLASILQGCATVKGVGQLLGGIGKDLQDGSDGYRDKSSKD
jgi:predicted small secreted protein